LAGFQILTRCGCGIIHTPTSRSRMELACTLFRLVGFEAVHGHLEAVDDV
jgi:hypothetical protein